MMKIEQWWAPRDIRFSLEQVKWLVGYLPLLREGKWPSDTSVQVESERTGSGNSVKSRAPFESAAMVAAELDQRITACGLDGWLVKAVFGWGEDSVSLGISDEELYRRVGHCLKYVSGWQRKKTTYREFIGHRKGDGESCKL
jgi:hypothetical protein